MSNNPPKIAIVTGANTGIGLVTATELSKAGYRVFITCRDQIKAEKTIAHIAQHGGKIPAEYLLMDLGDLDSVRECAAQFIAKNLPLDRLINNAGVARLAGFTKQGFENTFGINHLGTFLFTNLLLDNLKQAQNARIITVASRAHYWVKKWDLSTVKNPTSYLAMPEYSFSKLANILFTKSLSTKLKSNNINTYCLHPGDVATDVWRNAPKLVQLYARWKLITPEQGARTTLYCCLSEEAGKETGLYYDKSKPKKPSAFALNPQYADELWQKSLEWVGLA